MNLGVLQAYVRAWRTQEYEMRSRLGDAARDKAEGNITLEEVTRAILDAIGDRKLWLADQGAFYNPPEQPETIELNMEAFDRLAMAIARNRECTAALIRNARPRPSSDINPGISSSSVGGGSWILLPLSPSPSCSPPHANFLL